MLSQCLRFVAVVGFAVVVSIGLTALIIGNMA